MQDIFEPSFAEWPDILRNNLATRGSRDSILGAERVKKLRNQLYERAREYSESVAATAKRGGIHTELRLAPFDSANTPIIMAGHQPVVYHPGLLIKVQSLVRFAELSTAVGINIVIDTDQGDAGMLHWPSLASGSLEIKFASIATKRDSLYSDQRVESESVVAAVFESIEADLCRCAEVNSGANLSIEQARLAGSLYKRLSGESLSIAHTVVRWALLKSTLIELPLSIFVQETELREIIREFASDGIRLAETYNKTLDAYRYEHRIANQANPFPNMKCDQANIELPIWRVFKGSREALFYSLGMRSPAVAESKQGAEYLAPRGSITTMLLRSFCSDFFIHGLGGANYDRFVDQLSSRYLGVDLPRYVVTSGTRHLFPERVAELRNSLELSSKVKEITAKTEAFLGRGIFVVEEEAQLAALISERTKLREALKRAANPAERSSVAHKLNAANRAVRNIVESGSLRSHIESAASNEAALPRWSFREYPFFIYGNQPKFRSCGSQNSVSD